MLAESDDGHGSNYVLNPKSLLDFKIVIPGTTAVGKTCLAVRFALGVFSPRNNPTVGASYLTKNIRVDGVNVRLQLWDTAGQERFRSLAPMYYRGASVALLVFDVTQQDSFTKIKDWVEELRVNISDDIVMAVVGNKMDLQKVRTVPRDRAKEFADSINAQFHEVSAKDNQGVNEMFVDIVRRLLDERKSSLFAPELEASSLQKFSTSLSRSTLQEVDNRPNDLSCC